MVAGVLLGLPAADATPAQEAADVAPVVPKPLSHLAVDGPPFELTEDAAILVRPKHDPEVRGVAEYLAGVLRPSTGFGLPVVTEPAGPRPVITLNAHGSVDLGAEGYRLRTAGPKRLILDAHTPEGLFRGVQTLRQLLPPEVEADTPQTVNWDVDAVDIADRPRFEYRSVMLDVARRFVEADDVKRFIDQAARYKVNVFHWHITDDQGWRLPVAGIPELTTIGGSTQSGWAPGTGGPWYYTAQEYREIVEYARERYITVVPEIDGPGHTWSALASVPGLNCDDTARPPYYGFNVGVSVFCLSDQEHFENVREFIDTVFTAAAELSPGAFLHIGGDEVPSVTDEQYADYIDAAGDIVKGLGKRVVGWHQISDGPLPPDSVVQYWGQTDRDRPTIGTSRESRNVRQIRAALDQGAKVLMSPADRTYLDMKYNTDTPFGLQWTGFTPIEKAYGWDPMTALARPDGSQSVVTEEQVIGVESPLWTDRAYYGSSQLPTSLDQFPEPTVYMDFMAFPRLPAIAEIGWSSAEAREWTDFRDRLAAQGPRWDADGIAFYRSAEIDWPSS